MTKDQSGCTTKLKRTWQTFWTRLVFLVIWLELYTGNINSERVKQLHWYKMYTVFREDWGCMELQKPGFFIHTHTSTFSFRICNIFHKQIKHHLEPFWPKEGLFGLGRFDWQSAEICLMLCMRVTPPFYTVLSFF